MADANEKILKSLGRLQKQLLKIRQEALSPSDMGSEPTIFLRGTFEEFSQEEQRLTIFVDGDERHYPLSYYESQWLPMPGQHVTITTSSGGAPLRSISRSAGEDNQDEIRAGSAGAPLIRGFGRGGMSIPPAQTRLFTVKSYVPSKQALRIEDANRAEFSLTLPPEFNHYYPAEFRNGDPMHFRIIDVPPGQFFVPLTVPETARNRRARVLQLLTGTSQ